MRYRAATAIAAATAALSLTACGGSQPSQAQVRSCWSQHLAAYAQQDARSFTSGIPTTAATLENLAQTTGRLLVTLAPQYEAHNAPATKYNAEFKKLEHECGTLRVK